MLRHREAKEQGQDRATGSHTRILELFEIRPIGFFL